MIHDIEKCLLWCLFDQNTFLKTQFHATYTFVMQIGLSVVNVLFNLGHSQVLQ